MSPFFLLLLLAASPLSSSPPPELKITVTVVDDDGQALPGATVELARLLTSPRPPGETLAEVMTDDVGSAGLTIPSSGLYTIRASLDGFLPAEVGPFLVTSRPETSALPPVRLVLNQAAFAPESLAGVNTSDLPREIWGPFHGIPENQLNDLRETVLRRMRILYEEMPPQYDDPTGRRYCLAFDRTMYEDGYSPSAEFLRRFADDADVHELQWCDAHDGRVLSVGPIVHSTEKAILLWTLSWVDRRPGGSVCLRLFLRQDGSWRQEGECLAGVIYN